jgi:hypothetical protein
MPTPAWETQSQSRSGGFRLRIAPSYRVTILSLAYHRRCHLRLGIRPAPPSLTPVLRLVSSYGSIMLRRDTRDDFRAVWIAGEVSSWKLHLRQTNVVVPSRCSSARENSPVVRPYLDTATAATSGNSRGLTHPLSEIQPSVFF